MALKNVAIIGGSGLLGTAITNALISSPSSFTITSLVRQSSRATFPNAVRTIALPDDLPEPALVEALQGQDALIMALPSTEEAESIRLADACIKAGVQRLIPADFGSGDSADAHAQEVYAGYAAKARVRAHLESLAGMHEKLSWTSILCGHFFDRNLRNGLLHFDLARRKADIFDGGEQRWSASTLERIGDAVVRVLERPGGTRNRMLYIQSFCVSQRDVLRSLEQATGQEWAVSFLDSREYLEGKREALAKGDRAAIEDVVLLHGMASSNWEVKEGFANDLLGLKDEDLDLVVQKVVDSS